MSEAPVDPFASASVADSAASALDSVTIQLSGSGAGGTLSGDGLTAGPSGSYTLAAADAATVTAELQALSFTPAKGQDNASAVTSFTITATSSAAPGKTSKPDANFSVKDSDPAVAPTVVGGGALSTTSGTYIYPFAMASIGDTNANSTDTLTITLSHGGAGGILSGRDLGGGKGGVYTLAAPDAATLTSELMKLTFTPTPGQAPSSTTTTFTLSDKATAFATPTSDGTTTVTDVEPGTAPILTGGGSQTTTSEKPISPFAGASVADATPGATETLTIALGGGGGGILAGAGTVKSDGTYTLTGTAAAVTAQLAAVSFTPNKGPDGTSAVTTFTLTDQSSGYYATVSDGGTSVTDVDPAVSPIIAGTAASRTTGEAPVSPFTKVVVTDSNAGATDTLTIALGGSGGTLAGAGAVNPDGTYTIAGTAAAVTAQLAAVSFTPTAGLPDTAGLTTFTLTDKSSAAAAPVTDATTTVTDVDAAVAPTIAGTAASQTTGEAPVSPFAKVVVTDSNAGATDTLTIALGGGGGTLAGAGTAAPDGTYTLTGTAAAVTAQLAAVSFTPTAGLPDTAGVTSFTLTDASSASTNPRATDATTTVTDVDAAVAPTIAGTAASQTTDEAPVSPFAKVVVTDSNAGATDTLTIALGGSGGTLAGAGAVNPDGTYTIAGTAAAVTAQLAAVSFTPTAGLPDTAGVTSFTLSDVSSASTNPRATDGGTSVTNSDVAVAPIVPSAPDQPSAPVAPIDPSAPDQPSAPVAPIDPSEPDQPSAPIVPSEPMTPAASGAPIDAVSIDPTVVFDGRGTFTLTGHVSSTAGVAGVELSGVVGGQVQDLGAATVAADGTFSFIDKVGRNTQTFITATETDGSGGTVGVDAQMSLTGGVRHANHVATQDSFGGGGDTYESSTSFRKDGSRIVDLQAGGQVLQANSFDTFDNHGLSDNTFVFKAGHGLDILRGFAVTGEGHDTLDLPLSDFAGIADVLRNTIDTGSGSVIHDPNSTDLIRLAGVTKEQLARNTQDFSFHA